MLSYKPQRTLRYVKPMDGVVIPGPFRTWEQLPAEIQQQYYSDDTASTETNEGENMPGLSPMSLGNGMDVEPIDAWIWEKRLAFPRGPDNKLGLATIGGPIQSFTAHVPGARQGITVQVELTPEQLDRYKVLAGNELKDPNTHMGAKDTLNALVNGVYPEVSLQKDWNKYTDEGKALMVQATVNRFRAAAKQQLEQEFADLNEILTAGWKQKAAQVQGGQQPASNQDLDALMKQANDLIKNRQQ